MQQQGKPQQPPRPFLGDEQDGAKPLSERIPQPSIELFNLRGRHARKLIGEDLFHLANRGLIAGNNVVVNAANAKHRAIVAKRVGLNAGEIEAD